MSIIFSKEDKRLRQNFFMQTRKNWS